MRVLPIITLALITGIYVSANAVRAEQSSSCPKSCSDQQKACTANYKASTCKVEFDRCMKACTKK